ncbi:ABC transporter ATP-binding protein [Sulfodiicoccus acidiphilus]|uniref:ABC transporter ATP-binding protein n=1 Tax=Sulfodiicoccus acidiphilus TaxID=1670455 RepID=A0A348B2C0_9CREN|nr:ATP-binding cassette domain-containing protein [Sulfodiicoccus acidiphilus]BBD72322.1 ABC transporter ATP-binding protein [Sulfodiicoccus acidiphilus]GGT90283.1 ABC transporter ATP-binding protein [Sulfodiicoccus acidiphilus]
MEYSIEVEDLVKKYGDFVALDSISFKVPKGRIFGLLGPNGAGKTTTIKILTGLIPPTSGKALVSGLDVVRQPQEVKSRIGWISSDVILDDDLNAWENLEIQGKLQGVRDWKERAAELLKYFDLFQYAKRPVGKYSTGMRKKLEIASALLHSPEVIFMDEPTIGLDVNTRSMLWSLIRTVSGEMGVTVFLTTHYMEEADSLCSTVAIITQGRIVAMGTPEELKSRVGGDVVELEVEEGFDPNVLKNVPGMVSVNMNDGKVRVKVNSADRTVVDLLKSVNFSKVKSLKIEKPTLDTVFMELTGKKLDDSEVDYRKFYMTIRRARRG